MFYSILPTTRPNMVQPLSKKDEKYDSTMLRSFISTMNTQVIQNMHLKSIVAEKFYNDQQLTQEDIDTWLLDETKNTRNRVMFGFNMIKPVVEQYRGTTIQTAFNATVQAVTKGVMTRRMNNMAHAQLMHMAAESSPDMKRSVSQYYPIGSTAMETMENAKADDQIERAFNRLLRSAAAQCQMGRFSGEDAFRFAFCGVLPEIARAGGSYIRFDKIHPREFFWDTSAKLPDLSDASFMGCCPMMSMPQIAELYGIDRQELKFIDESIRQYAFNGLVSAYLGPYSAMNQTKIRVWEGVWIDECHAEMGYVMQNGVPTLVRIGDYGEKEVSGRPKYTHNELIDPPEGAAADKFGDRKTMWRTVEHVRTCTMIPVEYLCGKSPDRDMQRAYEDGKIGDLVLHHGVYPLQEYNPYDPKVAVSPIKAITYAIADGEIVSPVQAIIDPNRFVNRILGSIEGQANASGGKSPLVDMDLVDMTQEELQKALKTSDTIRLRAGGRGAANAVGAFDNNMGTGAYALLQIVQSVQDMMRTVTGVHSPMVGEGMKDQGKGVTEMLIQRGSISQESFHEAYADLQWQKYQFLATAGKEFYLQRPDVIMDMVSDEDLIWLFATRDMAIERFGVQVLRDSPDRARRAQANDWLNFMLERQIISAELYAELYNNSYPEDVSVAIRQYTKELAAAQKKAQQDAAKAQQQAALMQQAQELEAQQEELHNQRVETANMVAKEGAKAEANMEREQVAAELAQQQQPEMVGL